ncbi:phage tail protein [Lactiplantibacillus plantarum]
MCYILQLKNAHGDETAIAAYDVAVTDSMSNFSTLGFGFLVNNMDPSDSNKVGADMMIPGTIITVPETGQQYRLLTSNPASVGNMRNYTVSAIHVSKKLHDHYVGSVLTGTQSLKTCMDLIIKNTQFTYVIDGSFANYAFSKNFGKGFADELLMQNLAGDFGFEYYFDNYVIHIAKKIGKSNAFVFVDNVNCSKISENNNYENVTTHITGEGKLDNNNKPVVTAEYTSPNADVWGTIDAQPQQYDNITDKNTLLAKLKAAITDYPDIQYTMEYVDFKKQIYGFNPNDIAVGNSGWLRDRFGVDVEVRINSMTKYPQERRSDETITFGNKLFDPVVWETATRKAYESNIKLGKELKQDLITLNQYYQQFKADYSKQSSSISGLQDQINLLQSNGIVIDVSSNNVNSSTDWFASLVANGAKRLIVKLTQSTDYINPLAATQIANGKSAGLDLVGCYHYFMGNGIAEGQYFLAQLKANNVPTTAIVACDIENTSIDPTKPGASFTKDELNTQIATFYKVLNNAGYTVTCDYASASHFGTWFDSAARYRWIASWDASSKPAGANIWQFSNNWLKRNVDANYMYI